MKLSPRYALAALCSLSACVALAPEVAAQPLTIRFDDSHDFTCSGTGNVETGWASIQSLGVSMAGGLPVAGDGALLGSITSGSSTALVGGRLLWESADVQTNGTFHGRPAPQ